MHAAYWASWATHEQQARHLSEVMGREADHAQADAAAFQAEEALLELGVKVQLGYVPHLTPDAKQTFQAGPWSQEAPMHNRPGAHLRYMGSILQLLEGIRATYLWQQKPKLAKTEMLAAGGPKTGMTWTANPDTTIGHLPDAHWRCITRERLGMLRARPGTQCGLPRSARRGGCCGKALDPRMRHVWHCRTAVARLRIHNSINYALASDLRAAKGNVDVERAMPDMAVRKADGSIEEAVMDLTCWFPGSAEWHGVDVTVRYPGATRYYGAADHAGRAATKAEAEKIKRYGQDVLPLAFETGGRLGSQSRGTLRTLAAKAAATGGGILTAAGIENRWRRHLESALLFAVADALLLAMGGDQAADLAKPRSAFGGSAAEIAKQVPVLREADTPPARALTFCTDHVQYACPPCELAQEIEDIVMDDLGHEVPSDFMVFEAEEEAAEFLQCSSSASSAAAPSSQAALGGQG